MSFYQEIDKFLKQAKTTQLGTSDYLKEYSGLSVKVSFGKGNLAKVPWIAFLNEVDSVQQGIYPVYLYYKDKDLLILAYGVSETNKPNRNWDIANPMTIAEYFSKNQLGFPERYGSSFVYKIYKTNKPLSHSDLDNDLNELLGKYHATEKKAVSITHDFQAQLFQDSITEAGLFVTPIISIRLIASLLTKPFVILTGLSGSGKTKLAQAFAKWICASDSQYCVVPIAADWTNREPLLGFPNALVAKDYVKPDNKVLDLIIDANNNQDKPYFLILDEMNLSHVERYFADFLSGMESKENILLHSGSEEWNGVPGQIGFPRNLFIIGTVNIDETTYMFSPKVLDRASVIEFRVTTAEMDSYLKGYSTVNLASLKAEGSSMAESFVTIAKDTSIESESPKLMATLLNFFSELRKTGAEFGYRSASEILRFAAVINKLNVSWEQNEIEDAVIMQKLLPKVHGSRRKLEPVLKTLGGLCLNDAKEVEALITKVEINVDDISKIKYPISFEKIQRMYQGLLSNGFTSYAEA